MKITAKIPPRYREVAEAEVALQPGQKMADGTIYLGQYKPKDLTGKSLSKTFNVFVAPEDLPTTMTYHDTVKHVAGLKSRNGYDGTNYATDKELYAAVQNGSYAGGWIIPTRDMVEGLDADRTPTMPDYILAHKDKGAFKGSFKSTFTGNMLRDSGDIDWYWSSTNYRRYSSREMFIEGSSGNAVWRHKDSLRLNCRPVRLVEAP